MVNQKTNAKNVCIPNVQLFSRVEWKVAKVTCPVLMFGGNYDEFKHERFNIGMIRVLDVFRFKTLVGDLFSKQP